MGHHTAALPAGGNAEHDLALIPHAQLPVATIHLDPSTRQRWGAGQAVEDAVECDIALPADLPLLTGEAFPRPALRHGAQAFLPPAVHRALVRRAVHARIHLPTPWR